MKEWCLQNPRSALFIIVWCVFWFAMAADSIWGKQCTCKCEETEE